MALLGATATVTALWVDASSTDMGIVELIDPGADSAAAPQLHADFADLVFPPGIGHDGQSYYLISRSPMHLDDVAPFLDRPRYRAGRPLLPWLGWLLHPQGGGTGLVLALVSSNAAALVLGGIAAGGLAAAAGARSRIVGYLALLFPLAPGSMASFGLTTPDILATALALLAVLLSWHGRARSAVVAGVLAVLAKESIFLVLLGYALSRRRRADWVLAGVPVLVAGAWAVALRFLLPESSESLQELRPFVHLPRLVRGWLHGEDAVAGLIVVGVAAMGVVVLVRCGIRSAFAGIVVLQLAMLPMLHFNVLQLNWNASRTMLPLMVFSAIALSSHAASVPASRPLEAPA